MYYLIANRMLIDKSKAGSPVAEKNTRYLEIKPININIYTHSNRLIVIEILNKQPYNIQSF